MSNKYLAVPAWEAVAKKSKLDPKLLSKALTAYEKCDEKDTEGLEKALGDVKKAAAALEKDKDYKEAAKYLGEVGDAAAEELKELLKKPEEEEAEEKEEEEGDDAQMGQRLITALNAVKTTGAPAPGEPSPEAMKFVACLGTGGCGLMVGRNLGAAAKKTAASLAGGDGKYLHGDCIFENNKHTFVLEQPAAGLAKKFAKALQAETGQKYKVRIRSTDGSQVLDDETDAESAQEAAPGASPAPGDASGEVKERLAKLMPQLKQAMTAPGEKGAAAKAIAAQISALVKAGDYAGALAAIAQLETMLGGAPTGATEADPDRERWLELHAELLPGFQMAVDRSGGSNPAADEMIRKIQAVWQWAESHAQAGEYGKGIDALEKIAPLFDQAIEARENGAAPEQSGVVGQRQFLLKRWGKIPGELHAEVAKLEQQIAANMPEEDAGELGGLMDDYIDDFLSDLNDEVNNAINAGNVSGLSALKTKVSGDPLFSHLLSTPFLDGKVFQGVVIGAIEELETNLSK